MVVAAAGMRLRVTRISWRVSSTATIAHSVPGGRTAGQAAEGDGERLGESGRQGSAGNCISRILCSFSVLAKVIGVLLVKTLEMGHPSPPPLASGL